MNDLPKPQTLAEMAEEFKDLPESYFEEMEYCFRRGYWRGIRDAAESVEKLYTEGGYARPREIANILTKHSRRCEKWAYQSINEKPLITAGVPEPVFIPWPKLKKLIHARDRNMCRDCGSTDQLEVHHVVAVKDGGTPDPDNLVTLCAVCHRGIGRKVEPLQEGKCDET